MILVVLELPTFFKKHRKVFETKLISVIFILLNSVLTSVALTDFCCSLPETVVRRNNSILFPRFRLWTFSCVFTWECLTLLVVSDSVAVRCRKLWVTPVCIVITLPGLSGLLRAVLVSLPTLQRLESWDAWHTTTLGPVFACTGLSGLWFRHCRTFTNIFAPVLSSTCVSDSWRNWNKMTEMTASKRGHSHDTRSEDPADVKHESTVWLFQGSTLNFTEIKIRLISCSPSKLTFSDVLIGIDLVRGKMWPSETIIFWPSSKSIGKRGGIRRNRTQRYHAQWRILQRSNMKVPCDFFKVPLWPSHPNSAILRLYLQSSTAQV